MSFIRQCNTGNQQSEIQIPARQTKSALLPALHIAQAEKGWLPCGCNGWSSRDIANQTNQVYEVATFYTMFHVKPVGKYVIEVCLLQDPAVQ